MCYNRCMNVMTTLATRIGKKSVSIEADKVKIKNLRTQIEMYEGSIVRSEASIAQKQEEVDLLLDLQVEADGLVKRRDALQKYTDGLVKKFEAIEWRPEMDWSEKIESTDYAEKVAERQAINVRLVEIEKIANKTYFRR